MKRVSGRACTRCRSRKSKCDLDSSGTPGLPPCERCIRDGEECVLASSNRGGRRIRKNRSSGGAGDLKYSRPFIINSHPNGDSILCGTDASPRNPGVARNVPGRENTQETADEEQPTIESTIASTSLHNTTDTLNFLSHTLSPHSIDSTPKHAVESVTSAPSMSRESLPYQLVLDGFLTVAQIANLVACFAENYHPYLPIAPRRVLDPANLRYVALNEPHLLTAMITIAAKDLPDGPGTLTICSRYMQQLVAELTAGKRCDVEAVEALLLLAEWEPQSLLSDVKEVGCGEEDRSAWMHIGLALRLGYWLRLDRTSFRDEDEDRQLHANRKRLAWSYAYVADRLISVRIGRAFWSRGPAPMTALKSNDFPTLQPQSPGDDDYASILHATLGLTQLYTNVHEVLYSGMGSSMKMMLVGNYVKYVDDFRMAISGWKSIWGTLDCSSNLKATLQMSYEYLRLYTNAYAFQATTSRAISSKLRSSRGRIGASFDDVASMPDARFIYESVDAAKSLLTTFNNYVDPEKVLKFLPLRFFLYGVNSTIFLYKAWSFNILKPEEKVGVRRMINTTISRLRLASRWPHDFGSRYAQLLELLWQRTDPETNSTSKSHRNSGKSNSNSDNPPKQNPHTATSPTSSIQAASNSDPNSNSSYAAPVSWQSSSQQRPPQQQRMRPPESPAGPQSDFFSWLDLQAVGDAVSGVGVGDPSQASNHHHSLGFFSGPGSGVDGIQQFLDGASRRTGQNLYSSNNHSGHGHHHAAAAGMTGVNGGGSTTGAGPSGGIPGGDESDLAWLFDDDLVWPNDEYSNLIF